MWRTVFLYGLLMAAAAFVLQWLELRYAVRHFSTEAYIAILAVLFAVLGMWVGHWLTRTTSVSETFAVNEQALKTLGISPREVQVLERLARGDSNQEIAEALFVSANTIKTHLKNLYAKLDVSRRTQAVGKARELGLIP